MTRSSDSPLTGPRASTHAQHLVVVRHPAFRIGFLDAQFGRPFDHDQILNRIATETPEAALTRLRWWSRPLLGTPPCENVVLAQYHYEEGRILCIEYGLRCRGWNHPDYPPKAICDWIERRVEGVAA